MESQLNEIELIELKKAAQDSSFYSSLLNQYEQSGSLSTKQLSYVKSISKKKVDAIKNNTKLFEFN